MVRDFWVFAYGSLMWDPGFVWQERHPALLHGFHRSLCIFSHVWRGTPHSPGLVLGLDRGGSCRGVAYRVEAARLDEVIAYLDARERVTEVYLRRELAVTVGAPAAAERVRAIAYVADRGHPQYAGRLAEDAAAGLIRLGVGRGGPNVDYLVNTVRHLDALGITDGPLHRLEKLVTAAGSGLDGAQPHFE